jgi:hypothetical protein
MVYSNGITMAPGITYSAALWYATEYFGYSNWTSLTLLVGPNQSPTGLVPIASVSPAISGPYKLLSGTFTVPTPGDYFIAIRANGSNGSATYLSFDDLSVTIPCEGPGAVNSPTVSLSASSNTVCEGDPVSLNANGATNYLWSNSASGAAIVVNPATTSSYSVTGTNSITGCSNVQSVLITVNPTPSVFVVSNKPEICPGETAYLTGYMADSYAWTTGAVTNPISVNPTVTTTYSVIGSNAAGCAKTASIQVVVKPAPNILVTNTGNTEICAGEQVNFIGTGGTSYLWYSSANSIIYSGNPLTINLNSSATFTAVGTGTNGCTNKATVSQNVANCTGLTEVGSELRQVRVYPNPSSGMFNFSVDNGLLTGIIITDVSGRAVMHDEVGGETIQVDLSSLSNGVYFAKLISGNDSSVIRIIKN